jgi:hypothetical protein
MELFSGALRIRWLWLQKTDASRPWAGLPFKLPPHAQALFDIVVVTVVGNGESTKSWTDGCKENLFRTGPPICSC